MADAYYEIKLNEEMTTKYGDKVIYTIRKETEKAIQLHIISKELKVDKVTWKESEQDVWVPKSATEKYESTSKKQYLILKPWVVETKGLPAMYLTVSINGPELKEKYGISLAEITPQQHIELYEQGLCKENCK